MVCILYGPGAQACLRHTSLDQKLVEEQKRETLQAFTATSLFCNTNDETGTEAVFRDGQEL